MSRLPPFRLDDGDGERRRRKESEGDEHDEDSDRAYLFSVLPSTSFRPLKNASDIAAVACGSEHVLLLTHDRRVLTCGSNASGQLGNGEPGGRAQQVPTAVRGLDLLTADEVAVGIACGDSTSIVVTSAGRLYVSGRGFAVGRFALLATDVYAAQACIAGGYEHIVAVSVDRTRLFVWNEGTFNQPGDTDDSNEDHLQPHLPKPTVHAWSENCRILRVACGMRHTLVVVHRGISANQTQVWAFGDNSGGQCGVALAQRHVERPTLVRGLRHVNVSHVSGGPAHSAAITFDGEAYHWGNGEATATRVEDLVAHICTHVSASKGGSVFLSNEGPNGSWSILLAPLPAAVGRSLDLVCLRSARRSTLMALSLSSSGQQGTCIVAGFKPAPPYALTQLLYTHHERLFYRRLLSLCDRMPPRSSDHTTTIVDSSGGSTDHAHDHSHEYSRSSPDGTHPHQLQPQRQHDTSNGDATVADDGASLMSYSSGAVASSVPFPLPTPVVCGPLLGDKADVAATEDAARVAFYTAFRRLLRFTWQMLLAASADNNREQSCAPRQWTRVECATALLSERVEEHARVVRAFQSALAECLVTGVFGSADDQDAFGVILVRVKERAAECGRCGSQLPENTESQHTLMAACAHWSDLIATSDRLRYDAHATLKFYQEQRALRRYLLSPGRRVLLPMLVAVRRPAFGLSSDTFLFLNDGVARVQWQPVRAFIVTMTPLEIIWLDTIDPSSATVGGASVVANDSTDNQVQMFLTLPEERVALVWPSAKLRRRCEQLVREARAGTVMPSVSDTHHHDLFHLTAVTSAGVDASLDASALATTAAPSTTSDAVRGPCAYTFRHDRVVGDIPRGARYLGMWYQGLPHGRGRLEYEPGVVFVGDFVEGRRHGVGRFVGRKGDHVEYVGEYVRDRRTGDGQAVLVDGSVYCGQWLDDVRSGFGTLVHSERRLRYAGSWSRGRRAGFGVQMEGVRRYVGEWADGRCAGVGCWSDREQQLVCVGRWTAGRMVGPARVFCGNEGVFDGIFSGTLKTSGHGRLTMGGMVLEGSFVGPLVADDTDESTGQHSSDTSSAGSGADREGHLKIAGALRVLLSATHDHQVQRRVSPTPSTPTARAREISQNAQVVQTFSRADNLTHEVGGSEVVEAFVGVRGRWDAVQRRFEEQVGRMAEHPERVDAITQWDALEAEAVVDDDGRVVGWSRLGDGAAHGSAVEAVVAHPLVQLTAACRELFLWAYSDVPSPNRFLELAQRDLGALVAYVCRAAERCAVSPVVARRLFCTPLVKTTMLRVYESAQTARMRSFRIGARLLAALDDTALLAHLELPSGALNALAMAPDDWYGESVDALVSLVTDTVDSLAHVVLVFERMAAALSTQGLPSVSSNLDLWLPLAVFVVVRAAAELTDERAASSHRLLLESLFLETYTSEIRHGELDVLITTLCAGVLVVVEEGERV